MIRWLARNKIRPINAFNGDTITATYSGSGRREEVKTVITKAVKVDTIAIGELEDEHGFKRGVMAVFGEDT